MPSYSYRYWRMVRTRALDEIAQTHALIGGSARGRRYATQQLNRAYAVLLASKFQGFCRDLHSECVDHILSVVGSNATVKALLRDEFIRGRQLDRGNAQPSSLGADFSRVGIDLWDQLKLLSPSASRWSADLELLNHWRNAIVHEDFTSTKLGGIIILRLSVVRKWRRSCAKLAKAMDVVAGMKMQTLTGVAPW